MSKIRYISFWGDRTIFVPDRFRKKFGLLDEEEQQKVLGFLKTGTIVLRSQEFLTDPLSSNTETLTVPTSVFTDGTWVWDGSITFFVENYSVAPPSKFLKHIRGNNYKCGIPTTAELTKIESTLLG